MSAEQQPPRIWLTNFASLRSAGFRGFGRVWSIMAMPRRFEQDASSGTVEILVPRASLVREVKSGTLDWGRFARLYRGRVTIRAGSRLGHILPPGLGRPPSLAATTWSSEMVPVADGDTLCCACSRAVAVDGRCHRVLAASLLRTAGWLVVLDGVNNPSA